MITKRSYITIKNAFQLMMSKVCAGQVLSCQSSLSCAFL